MRSVLSLAAWSVLAIQAFAAPPKPNVLLICVDDLKPSLGCYGDSLAPSPNIDRLAARGVTCRSAYCNQAVCSPSRNALLTSLRPQTLGIYELKTNFRVGKPDAITLGQHFKRHGYHTQSLGKIFHTGHGNRDDQDSWSVPSWKSKAPQYHSREHLVAKKASEEAKGPPTESADVEDDFFADGQTAAETIHRLKEALQHPDRPFLIACGFIRPHLPFVAPSRYWGRFDSSRMPMPKVVEPPAGAPSFAPQFGGELRNYLNVPAKGLLDEEQTRHLIHGYYAATAYMDAQVGKLLDFMDQHQMWNNTIVILWGDHGWHLGDHGMWCKHTNYEQATRIPVIWAGPGIATQSTAKGMIESVDIFPTLCQMADLPIPNDLDGQSFAPMLRDPSQPARDSVIHVYPRNARLGRAIRTPRYRMVEWKVPGGPSSEAIHELYDYESDPGETLNLADREPLVLSQLKQVLARHPEARPPVTQSASPAAAAR
jgi:iduronate 2-sulfatase